ncbi:MAG: S8 family serine peptidase [Thermoplasmata archaeon]
MTRKGRILAVLLPLVFLITIIPIENSSTRGDVLDVRISISSPQQAETLSSYRITEEYEGFVLASLTEDEIAELTAQGFDIQTEELYLIGIRGFSFDTRKGEPSIPDELRISDYSEGAVGYYIVQFRGPVRREWKESLSQAGAEIVNYVPFNAFLVRIDPGMRAALGRVQAVQWVGVFHPAYKVSPELVSETGTFEAEVITFYPEGVDTVLDILPEESILFSYKGKDFGRVDARIDHDQLVRVANLVDVNFIQPREVFYIHNSRMQWIMQTNINENRRIWDMGIRGERQLVGFSDTGIDFDHNLFREDAITIQNGDIYNATDMTRRKLVRYYVHGDPSDEWSWKDTPNRQDPDSGWWTSGHGTMVTGTFGGNDDPIATSSNDGGAKGAKIFFQDIGGIRWLSGVRIDSLKYIPADYDDLFGPAYDAGARIHSNSWGSYTTVYTMGAQMVDEFMWNHPDMLIIFSNGNGGRTNMASPATAKNVLSSGSGRTSPIQDSVAGYSSTGPTSDGRRKPTVIAVGEGISSMSSGNPRDNINTAWEGSWGGTSYSAPDHASLAAMTRQYFMEGWWPSGTKVPLDGFEPSAALVKAMLTASARQMQGQNSDSKNEDTWPNNSQGWGRVLLDDALYFAGDTRRLELFDDRIGLNTGEFNMESYYVLDSSEPLRIILAWTDYPGVAWTSPNIANDLDLLVTDPLGNTYKGNVFGTMAQGESLPNTGSYDRLNVLEGAHIESPMVGAWSVRVTAANAPNGPQPYALVTLGDLGTGWGQVFLDQSVYGENDTIGISVRDTGPSTVDVTMWSTTEPTPELISLNETSPGSGRWVGYINTSQGPPTTDGELQVSHGDLVTVQYIDDDPPHTSTDTATIDATYPLIFNIFVMNITSTSANVIWRTNEATDSKVYYNESDPLDLEEYVSGYRLEHDVLLTNLKPETIYKFDVESSDPYGHTTKDSNGGLHWQFQTLKLSPEPPTNPRAWLFGPDYDHVHIEWELSVDDPGLVDHYAIYYSTLAYDPDGTGYQLLATVPSGLNFFDHYLAGHGNPMNIYYVIQANYSAGLPARAEDQVAKFTRWTPAGPVLLSFPLKMVNESIEYALKTVSWDVMRYYDAWDDSDHWKEYHRWKNWNDLPTINQTMAIWVNVTSPEPVTHAGVVPRGMSIHLKEGWNLVGFPHMYYDYTVNDLSAQTGAERVEAFNVAAPPYFLYSLSGTTYMAPGEGYWIKVPAHTFWIL